ncbi:hypothetical protein FF1_002080 [Malus domestica]
MEGSGRCFHVLPNTTSASFVLRKHYSTLLCLYEQADADGNGTDHDEFIAATMHSNWMDKHLYTTFQHFDKRRDVRFLKPFSFG